jgi:hypothetical protein
LLGRRLVSPPRSRDRLDDHVWFCLEHIREYNRAWDYYAGMNQAEIERHMREDVVGGRPTWPLGHWGAGGPGHANGRAGRFRFRSDFFPDDVAETLAGEDARRKEARSRDRRLTRGPGVCNPRSQGARHPEGGQGALQIWSAAAPDARGRPRQERLKVINRHTAP